MKRRLRAYIIAFTALFMASCAAFFSVTGVGKLASGAGLAAILLVTALEVGKLVVASFIHKRWNQINWFQKIFATFGVVVAMALTSIGIFGQLIGGYTATSAEFQIGTQEIRLKEAEKSALQSKITRYEDQINRKTERADDLAGLRAQQEAQKDSLENRKNWYSAKQARILIKETNQEIQELNNDVDSLNNEINLVMEDIAVVDSSIVVMNGNLAQGEAAPLKMIADMLGVEMDSATKGFFGFFVLIFDPFAIMLVIFFNIEMAAVKRDEEELQIETEPEPEPKPEPEQVFVSPGVFTKEPPSIVYKHDEEGEFKKAEETAVAEPEPLPEAAEDQIFEIEEEDEEEMELPEPEPSILMVTLENKKDVYKELLRILYINGNVQPEGMIYTFPDYMLAIDNAGMPIQKEDVVKFLEFCVEQKIIEVGKHKRIALMSYQDALSKVELAT